MQPPPVMCNQFAVQGFLLYPIPMLMWAAALLALLPAVSCSARPAPALDRPSIVGRHNPTLASINSSELLVLGNGAFAMGIDVT